MWQSNGTRIAKSNGKVLINYKSYSAKYAFKIARKITRRQA